MSRSIAERSQQMAAAAPPNAAAWDIHRLRRLLLASGRDLLPPFLALTLAAGIWEAWVRLRDVPEYLVPAPSAIAGRLATPPSSPARVSSLSMGPWPASGWGRRSQYCWRCSWPTPASWSGASSRWRSW